MLLVLGPPRYHDPMSVNSPFSVNMAEFGPTFEMSDRKAPKYAYRVILLGELSAKAPSLHTDKCQTSQFGCALADSPPIIKHADRLVEGMLRSSKVLVAVSPFRYLNR